jgi:hypothetical protein
MAARTLERVFWSHVSKTDTCWLWTGPVLQNGYGRLCVRSQPHYAHRISHEMLIGPIPDGLEIDHLCRVRNCVNPDHLEAVTHAENLRRAQPYREPHRPPTQCRKGHTYDIGTTYCRSCASASNRRKYLARKARQAVA